MQWRLTKINKRGKERWLVRSPIGSPMVPGTTAEVSKEAAKKWADEWVHRDRGWDSVEAYAKAGLIPGPKTPVRDSTVGVREKLADFEERHMEKLVSSERTAELYRLRFRQWRASLPEVVWVVGAKIRIGLVPRSFAYRPSAS